MIRIGSRDSRLAVVQAGEVCRALGDCELVTMKTTGDMILDKTLDQVGGKGFEVVVEFGHGGGLGRERGMRILKNVEKSHGVRILEKGKLLTVERSKIITFFEKGSAVFSGHLL